MKFIISLNKKSGSKASRVNSDMQCNYYEGPRHIPFFPSTIFSIMGNASLTISRCFTHLQASHVDTRQLVKENCYSFSLFPQQGPFKSRLHFVLLWSDPCHSLIFKPITDRRARYDHDCLTPIVSYYL